MEVEAAKMIGAGIACIALAGAGLGIGNIFGSYLSAAMRNPSAAQKQFPNLLLGFALAEATGLFGLVVALIILFRFLIFRKWLNFYYHYLFFYLCCTSSRESGNASIGSYNLVSASFLATYNFWFFVFDCRKNSVSKTI